MGAVERWVPWLMWIISGARHAADTFFPLHVSQLTVEKCYHKRGRGESACMLKAKLIECLCLLESFVSSCSA